MEHKSTPGANTPLRQRFIGIHYTLIHLLYWMTVCGYYAFGASYLSERGLSSSLTGIVFALVGILSVLMQSVIATAADQRNASPKRISVWLTVPACVLLLLLVFVVRTQWLYITLYALVWVLVMSFAFLLNALAMDSVKAGNKVNYGISRSFGSMSYALTAYALGIVCAKLGTAITVPVAAVQSLLFLIALLTWREAPLPEKQPLSAEALPKQAPEREFFKRYPRFLTFVIGCTLCFIPYSMTCNFLVRVVEALGGGSSELGTTVMLTALLEIPTISISVWLNRKFGSNRLLTVSAIFLTLRMLLVTVAPSMPFLYGSMLTQTFSYSLFIPASVYYVDALMARSDRLKGQAVMTLIPTLGSAAGALLGGFLLDTVQVSGMLLVCSALSCIGTVIMVCGIQRGDMRPVA